MDSRRLSRRRPLARPLEADLVLDDEPVSGWVVDEQDDGLGMAFGGADVDRLCAFHETSRDGRVQLVLGDDPTNTRAIPVRLVHVTRNDSGHACRAGLSFDVARMAAEDIAHLMVVWRRLMAAPDA